MNFVVILIQMKKNIIQFVMQASFLGAGMNVEKITKKYISLYDYNLFNVRSTYKIPVNEINGLSNEKNSIFTRFRK